MHNSSLSETSLSQRYARPFFEAFLLALLISWNPVSSLAYLMPLICLGWFIIRANSGRTMLSLFAFCLCFLLIVLGYYVFYYNVEDINFLAGGAVLTLITYSSFIFLLVVPNDLFTSRYSYIRYARIFKYLILFQALLGIFQLLAAMAMKSFTFDGSMGDKVQGTISPFSFLVGTSDFGNIAFATNMTFLLLFFMPYVLVYRKGKFIFSLGAFSLLCASVLHILMALIAGIVVIGFLFRKFSKLSYRAFYVLGFIIIGFFLFAKLQPSNFTLIQNYAIIYAKAKSPKVVSTIDVVTELPKNYPTMLIVGLGPGQYSSRASLIATGKYLGGMDNKKNYFFLPNDMTRPFEEYLWDDWLESTKKDIYGGSAMSKPFYSVMSIYTELGLIILAVIILAIVYKIIKLRGFFLKAASNEKERINKLLAFSIALSLLFLLFICFIENYLEISQAIFPGLLMLKFFSSYIKSDQSLLAS